MGSSHIQPAWESNNNNKKSGRGGGRGEARLLPFLSAGADSPGSEGGRGGRAGAGGAGPGGGGGLSSLRGWDVPAASFAAGRRAGLGRGGGLREGAGGAARRCSSATCVALGLAPTAGSLAQGARSSAPLPRTGLHLLRRILNGESVRGPVLSAAPSARRPQGSRSLYL